MIAARVRFVVRNVIDGPPSKLKTPSSSQPCSSSPMSSRFGSADSVVLPVPESPKKMAVSPALPILADACMVMTP
ncbi:hypothetical protein PsorP6_001999 [Peronosclerospora sorghi]|uniref:Uncharacterized protein n=1 Tax=Peronosclerospora sorghi TaxID=230839 RepID=A0ACC0WY94_9STRA|nr:hypothetical protein PsorP6_001999 [Peronosclerospora sorghi]